MKIRFKAAFLKAISKINDERLKNELASIIVSIENVENISQISKIKKLKNTKSDYRIRSGDYRIGLRLEPSFLRLLLIEKISTSIFPDKQLLRRLSLLHLKQPDYIQPLSR